MTEPNKPPPPPKKTPVVATRGKAIVVGVTDLRELYKTPMSALPPDEVTVRLHAGKTTLTKHTWRLPKGGAQPRLWARFEEEVVPGIEYTATAFRRVGSEVVATALPKPVTLPENAAQAETDLELHHIPTLRLVEARFKGDHGVITASPTQPTTYTRAGKHHKVVTSWLGDGDGKSVKPEYSASRQRNNPLGTSSTRWDAASYDIASTVALDLKFVASVPDKRAHELDRVRVVGGTDALSFEIQTSRPLVDGGEIVLQAQAKAPLPPHVARLSEQLVLTVVADEHPVRVQRASHQVEVFVTLREPGGKANMHEKKGPGALFPDDGPTQMVTAERLRRAVAVGHGATDDEGAVRAMFEFLKKKELFYFPYYSYPPTDVANNLTGFNPPPPDKLKLHEFLWIGMSEKNICHCLDLAAGFRLLTRMVGVKGKMDVAQCFPWPPWDDDGDRRDLSKDKEPWQGSLGQYPMSHKRKLIFFDGDDVANAFEGVLRYQPPGSQRAILLAIGVDIYDAYGPDVKPGPMDDRNASLFFQASPNDKWQGKYSLAVKKPGGYQKPPFKFMKNKDQVRFMFHYDTDTIGIDDKKGS